jgi:hypothetical protein
MIVRRDQPGTGVGNDLFRDGFALDRRGTGEDDLSAVVAGGGDLVDDQSMHPDCDLCPAPSERKTRERMRSEGTALPSAVH